MKTTITIEQFDNGISLKWSYIHGSNDFEKAIRNHHIHPNKNAKV